MDVAEIARCFEALSSLKDAGHSSKIIAKRRELNTALVAAASPEHAFKIVGVTLDDTCVCACGWESPPYWDGAEYAYNNWKAHLKTVVL